MNTFGQLFRMTTWGESHGLALGVVIDGCPAGLPLTEDEISLYLQENDRPLPVLATDRQEPNNARILSGLYQGRTIGTPIAIIIENKDFRKNDYPQQGTICRPGHGDYTYHVKYGIPVLSGGGRASGRECITRLAAGYIAEKIIHHCLKSYQVETKITVLADISIHSEQDLIRAVQAAIRIAAAGDSSGGMVQVTVKGLPAGLGEPVFNGLPAEIAAGLMSIKAVKSVEFGAGREVAGITGSHCNDEFCLQNNTLTFISNQSGGTLSGISNGSDLVIRLAVKPTPTIRIDKNHVTLNGEIKKMHLKGRHDKNITPRIAPIARAMINMVLINQLMLTGYIRKDRLI